MKWHCPVRQHRLDTTSALKSPKPDTSCGSSHDQPTSRYCGRQNYADKSAGTGC